MGFLPIKLTNLINYELIFLVSQYSKKFSLLIIVLFFLVFIVIYLSKKECIHCGKSNNGFWDKSHKKCSEINLESRIKIKNVVDNYFLKFEDQKVADVNEKINESEYDDLSNIAQSGYINLPKELVAILNSKFESFLNDGILSSDEETVIAHFTEQFKLTNNEYLNSSKINHKIVRASIIRSLLNEKPLSCRISNAQDLPFNFMKSESLIYADANVSYSEKRMRTTYVGGSDGVSIKIAKGIYYRKSFFKGNAVQTLKTIEIGVGIIALTNKHLYFSSSEKSFRIRFDRIVSVEPVLDGILIQKEGVSSKPQLFCEIDGWFYYNFIKNSSNIKLEVNPKK